MRRYFVMLILFAVLPACTRVQEPNAGGAKSPVISGPPTSNAPSPPPGKLGQPEVPGNRPDRPQTPKTAAPGTVSPPPASGPPISTSEGP